MLFRTLTALSILVLPLASAFPVDTPLSISAAASGKNIYLVTCTPKAKNDDDDKTPDPNPVPFTAIAYFKEPLTNTTTESGKDPKPDQNVVVANPASAWEGVKWSVKAWKSKLFTSDIAAGAQSLEKGSIAGSAKLDTADYVCFKDGETKLRYKDDDLRGNCKADYWCASLASGKDKSS